MEKNRAASCSENNLGMYVKMQMLEACHMCAMLKGNEPLSMMSTPFCKGRFKSRENTDIGEQ